METILERYERYSFAERQLVATDSETQVSPWSFRNLLGEDLGPLNTNDLERLERQLDSSLKQIRPITQYMLDQLSDLQNKEHLLVEANRALTIKLDEISSRNNLRQSWEGGEQSLSYGPQNAQSQRFFQPLDCNPTLQIGYNASDSDQQLSGTTHAQQVNGFIPGWML
nr:developmental protein SEPALLATA 1-like [Quercus suber]